MRGEKKAAQDAEARRPFLKKLGKSVDQHLHISQYMALGSRVVQIVMQTFWFFFFVELYTIILFVLLCIVGVTSLGATFNNFTTSLELLYLITNPSRS